MSDYLDKNLMNTQPILLTIDNTKHCFSSTDVDTIPWKGYGIFHFTTDFIYGSAKWAFLEYPK